MTMNVKSLYAYYPRSSGRTLSLLTLQRELKRVQSELRAVQQKQKRMHRMLQPKKRESPLTYTDRKLVEKRLQELADQHEMRVRMADKVHFR